VTELTDQQVVELLQNTLPQALLDQAAAFLYEDGIADRFHDAAYDLVFRGDQTGLEIRWDRADANDKIPLLADLPASDLIRLHFAPDLVAVDLLGNGDSFLRLGEQPEPYVLSAPSSVPTALASLVGQGGQWIHRASSTSWLSEGKDTERLLQLAESIPGGPALAAFRARLAEQGRSAGPYRIEVENGELAVHVMGARRTGERGGSPPAGVDASALEELGMSAAHAAQFIELTGRVPNPEAERKHLWIRLRDHAGANTLETGVGNHLSALILRAIGVEAAALAIRRYQLDHPSKVSVDPSGLSRDLVKSRAQKLEQRVRELEADWDATLGESESREGLLPSLDDIHGCLEKAIDGDFTSAEGSLHAYIDSLGPDAYDALHPVDDMLPDVYEVDLEVAVEHGLIEDGLDDDDDDFLDDL